MKNYEIQNTLANSHWHESEAQFLSNEKYEEENYSFLLKFDPAWLVNERGIITNVLASWVSDLSAEISILSIDKKKIITMKEDETVFFDLKEAKEYSDECKINYRKSLQEKAEEILAELKVLK